MSVEIGMSSSISLKSVSSGALGIATGTSKLLRSLPTPKSSALSVGQSLVTTGLNVASSLVTGGDFNLTDLLNTQIQVQREMQVVSMASNVAKSEHEMSMAPIRNLRLS